MPTKILSIISKIRHEWIDRSNDRFSDGRTKVVHSSVQWDALNLSFWFINKLPNFTSIRGFISLKSLTFFYWSVLSHRGKDHSNRSWCWDAGNEVGQNVLERKLFESNLHKTPSSNYLSIHFLCSIWTLSSRSCKAVNISAKKVYQACKVNDLETAFTKILSN